MSRFAVLLPAAGQSQRFGGKEKKPFVNLDGRAIWLRTAELFVNRDEVAQCLVIVSPEDLETFKRRFGANVAFLNIGIVEGGSERFESVANALAQVQEDVDLIAIHDAVRPCVQPQDIDRVFAEAEKTGAAMLAEPVRATLKQVDKSNVIEKTISRENLWLAQTPQVFRKDWLTEAYEKRDQVQETITDDAQLVEALGHPVHVVESDASNLKITAPSDIALADAILKSRPKPKVKGPLHPFADEDQWR